jgi:DNA-binding NarL/FixJ family response regulator
MECGEAVAGDVLAHGLTSAGARSTRLLAIAKHHRSTAIRRAGWNLDSKRHEQDSRRIGVLSQRETQVLALMAAGDKNFQIAEKLFLSEKTVKTHVNHIFTKLGVTDRVQAVLYYRETIDPAGTKDTTVG